ncbi:hypothetical protein CRI70_08230 [Streptomyces sp. Ru87]|nr:hypothetical protein CRI70_08230 [Streptomyces sp. Ru87]
MTGHRLDGPSGVRHIEARHPALRGAKSPMQTVSDNQSVPADTAAEDGPAWPVLTGTATGVALVGAVLALTDTPSPLRVPFTLFFLVAAPAAAVASLLRGLDPLSRCVVAVAGAVAADVLTAQVMLALHVWSVRTGVAAVAALSAALFLSAFLLRLRHGVAARKGKA